MVCSVDKCDWKGTLSEYRRHYNTHFYKKSIKCEYCNAPFESKESLLAHLDKNNEECLMKPIDCIYKEIGCSSYASYKSDLPRDAQDVNYLRRENLVQHLNENANYHLELMVDHFKNSTDDLKSKIKELEFSETNENKIPNESNVDSIGFEKLKLNETDINKTEDKLLVEKEQGLIKRIDKLVQDQNGLVNDLTAITKNTDRVRKENQQLKESANKYKSMCLDLYKTLEMTKNSLKIAEQRLISQEKISTNGVLLLKISNVAEKIQEAKLGRLSSFYSQPFYSHPNGYKMCARLYLNGDGAGKNTHFSIFLVLLKGEHDALLNWPFKQKVTFTLFDQSELKENIVDAFKPDPNSSSFKRPVSEQNVASGLPLFCPLGKLTCNDNEYIKDNTMFVKVAVDTRGLNSV